MEDDALDPFEQFVDDDYEYDSKEGQRPENSHCISLLKELPLIMDNKSRISKLNELVRFQFFRVVAIPK